MKMFKRKSIPILLIMAVAFQWAGLSKDAGCEEAAGGIVLTLQDAIYGALEKNPRLDAAQQDMAASAEKITQASSGFYPQVFVSEAYQLTTNPMWAFGMKLNQEIITQQDFNPDLLNNPESIDNFNTMVGMNWALYDSGQTWFGRKQAKLAHQASVAGLDRTRQEIISETVAAYTNLVFARESVAVVQQALKTAEAHQRLIEDRYNSGLTVKSDVLRAHVHISELEQQLVEAESQCLIARAALSAMMGEDMIYDMEPATPLMQEAIPEKSLSEWIDWALARRPDLEQVKFYTQTAQAEIKKSRSAHLPSVNLSGSYELNTENFDHSAENYTVGANVTLNLFSGNRISAKEREAVYRHNEMSAKLQAMSQKVRLETRQAFYRVRSAEKRIQAARLSVTEAEEALRIVRNRYDNGQVSIVSLLDAELTVTRAKNNLNMALKDHMQSRAGLALAVGSLDQSFQ